MVPNSIVVQWLSYKKLFEQPITLYTVSLNGEGGRGEEEEEEEEGGGGRERRRKIKRGWRRRVEMIPSDKQTAKGGLLALTYAL